jgi:hypothetical protein
VSRLARARADQKGETVTAREKFKIGQRVYSNKLAKQSGLFKNTMVGTISRFGRNPEMVGVLHDAFQNPGKAVYMYHMDFWRKG